MNYKVYCPTYKRVKIAKSHNLFLPEHFIYVVREEQYQEYKNAFPQCEFMQIPRGTVKDLTQTRNWILENKISDYVVQIDDDYTAFNWNFERKLIQLTPEQIHHQIVNLIQLCLDAGTGMFGINTLTDPKAYSINKPYSWNCPILGPFQGIVDTDMRYDEELFLKEDYDMSLQMLKKHRRIVRSNFLSYAVDHLNAPGGCQDYRTIEEERRQNKMLKDKWGDVVHENYMHENSINMILKVPL